MDKIKTVIKTYLKMDIIGYHIFINIFVNHKKTTSSNIENLF